MKTTNRFVTIPLTQADRNTAQKIANQYSKMPKKQGKVLENILAVCAVKNYLQLLDIPIDINKSYSFNTVYQLMENVADLYLTEIGHLECRSVKPNQKFCYIPAETWGNRIGYIAVELATNFSQAKLLGFIDKVTTENLPIEDLNPLDYLLETITEIELVKQEALTANPALVEVANIGLNVTSNVSANISSNVSSIAQRIKNWVDKSLDLGWQTFEEVFNNSQLELAVNYRNSVRKENSIETMIEIINTSQNEDLRLHAVGVLGGIGKGNQEAIKILSELIDTTDDEKLLWQAASSLAKIDPSNEKSRQRSVRVINFEINLHPQELVLIISLLPYDEQQIRVILEVKSKNENEVLPPYLKFALLSENNEVLNEIISKSKPTSKVKARLINKQEEEGEDTFLEMRFLLPLGTNFRVKITHNNQSIIEDITI